ncbi:endonuclease/exonuclease/phosphatase family protein [Leptolyngbya sp. FACHB-261]|uniref:endonuclease/exonuclease/phosphatase family protein n=1 Tax=Leptolyngbya sp. FACHB-261 TaxID=2692806 RepID=UPI0028C4A758|nr:endonuclease/exonuclease/phosphatase family protein [Leptolyngbya sp. FACHB-261]
MFLLAADTTGTDPTVRLVMHTALEQAGGLLHLFNAHFSYSQPAFAANIAEALPFLASFSGPKLLVGDFNATPDAEPLQNLRDAGWQDQWQRFYADEPGYTFQSFQPQIRIDYVWADATVEPWVKALERVADGGVNDQVSDHFGLLVTLDLS